MPFKRTRPSNDLAYGVSSKTVPNPVAPCHVVVLPRDDDFAVAGVTAAFQHGHTGCTRFSERRTPAPAATRPGVTACGGTAVEVGTTAAATTTVGPATTAAAATAEVAGGICGGSACSAYAKRSVLSTQPPYAAATSSDHSSCAADSAFTLCATGTAAATTGFLAPTVVVTHPVTPTHSGKAAANTAATTVIVTFSAFSTCAARNEHAIVQRAAALAHVRCSGPTACLQACGAFVSASAATAVIAARTALGLTANKDGQRFSRFHCNRGCDQAAVSRRSPRTHSRNGYSFDAKRHDEVLLRAGVNERLRFLASVRERISVREYRGGVSAAGRRKRRNSAAAPRRASLRSRKSLARDG